MTLQDVIKRGLELGLEAVEVYACNSESNTLKLDEGKLESYKRNIWCIYPWLISR